jgi:hypothetical protein
MTTFTVDPATLQELSGALSSVHSQMQGMQGVASGYQGLLGGSDLEGGVEEFCGRWGYGITQLSDDMSDVVQRLNDAFVCYSKSEQEIQKAAGG